MGLAGRFKLRLCETLTRTRTTKSPTGDAVSQPKSHPQHTSQAVFTLVTRGGVFDVGVKI